MSSAGRLGRAWQWLRALPDRTPLRVKLITAMLTLVIIALGVISFASQAVFRGYLMHQARAQLLIYYQHVQREVEHHFLDTNSGQFIGDGLEQVWVLGQNGQQFPQWNASVQPPELPMSQAWLTANQGKVSAMDDRFGGHWLVITEQVSVPIPGAVPDPVTGQVPDGLVDVAQISADDESDRLKAGGPSIRVCDRDVRELLGDDQEVIAILAM